jgi:hypothetical protein
LRRPAPSEPDVPVVRASGSSKPMASRVKPCQSGGWCPTAVGLLVAEQVQQPEVAPVIASAAAAADQMMLVQLLLVEQGVAAHRAQVPLPAGQPRLDPVEAPDAFASGLPVAPKLGSSGEDAPSTCTCRLLGVQANFSRYAPVSGSPNTQRSLRCGCHRPSTAPTASRWTCGMLPARMAHAPGPTPPVQAVEDLLGDHLPVGVGPPADDRVEPPDDGLDGLAAQRQPFPSQPRLESPHGLLARLDEQLDAPPG